MMWHVEQNMDLQNHEESKSENKRRRRHCRSLERRANTSPSKKKRSRSSDMKVSFLSPLRSIREQSCIYTFRVQKIRSLSARRFKKWCSAKHGSNNMIVVPEKSNDSDSWDSISVHAAEGNQSIQSHNSSKNSLGSI